MKKTLKKLSLRSSVIILFTIQLLITNCVLGFLVFSNWLTTTSEHAEEIVQDINTETFLKIDNFINISQEINNVNNGFISNELIDLNNQIERERFFVTVLKKANKAIYSFSFGTVDGEYYGARRNANNEIEIMRNNDETNGHSYYYSVSDDLVADKLVYDAGKFDPRDRGWYLKAVERKQPIFSEVYKHFVIDDLAISAATPIYNNENQLLGVLGTHIVISEINTYLEGVINHHNGLAVIVEKNNYLIANSLNMQNFKNINQRITINDLDNNVLNKAINDYQKNNEDILKIRDSKLYQLKISKYMNKGLEWLIIIGIPVNVFTKEVYKAINLTVILTILALVISILITHFSINRFLKPLDQLIKVINSYTNGDLTQRAENTSNNEISRISKTFNKMADTITILVDDLESQVSERTEKLKQANIELKANQDHLKLVLDSTLESIYGMDTEGNCTFCNKSGLRILGYSSQEQLLGKNIHSLIHHSDRDGNSIPKNECRILNAVYEGKGVHIENEVFWRADGTHFDVEYYSYPQFRNGRIIGVVVTFMDITSRKKYEEHVKYLSYHDSLTGLYNRSYYENELEKINVDSNLPISVIYGDVNGLKITNDIFGHEAGDKLLRKTADILRKSCRKNDVIVRVGGDEFVIFLINTKESTTSKIIRRIKNQFKETDMDVMMASISLGASTKSVASQEIGEVIKKAESKMYIEKMFKRQTIDANIINKIISMLHKRNPKEKQHSINVSRICERIGFELGMNETEIRKLKTAGYYHDIGKIVLDDELINSNKILTSENHKSFEEHVVAGYRILNLFDETMNIAEGVLYHHEKWNGSGYPKGLKEKEIPLTSRIIKIAEKYDALTNNLNPRKVSKQKAITEIVNKSGINYDPKIVDVFVKIFKDH